MIGLVCGFGQRVTHCMTNFMAVSMETRWPGGGGGGEMFLYRQDGDFQLVGDLLVVLAYLGARDGHAERTGFFARQCCLGKVLTVQVIF